MAKRAKCRHGNAIVRMQGCAHCVMEAMGAWKVLRYFELDPSQLFDIVLGSLKKGERAPDAAKRIKAKMDAEKEKSNG